MKNYSQEKYYMKNLIHEKTLEIFPALKSRNYRLYFSGQLISLIGTWLQTVAQGWLVLQLTNSAFLIGLIAAISQLPTLFFSPFAGVIVDRFPKRKILFLTQTMSMILAFILGMLTIFNMITIYQIAFLGFLLGVVNAIDSPTRQAFAVELVGKEDLHSAIALNSGMFNGARVIGPSIAGFLIAIIGSGGAFVANAVSYIAVIVALNFMNIRYEPVDHHPHPVEAIKEGLHYTYSHPVVKTLLIYTGILAIFGWAYTTVLPLIAQNIFHGGAKELGYLYAAMGMGALLATFVVSAISKKISMTIFILGGNVFFVVFIILFTLTTNMQLALLFLFLVGFGLICQSSMINTTIQRLIDDRYRGRVMGLYTLMFMGMFPLGNFQMGFVSEHFGTGTALRLGAFIIFISGIYLYFSKNRIQKAHEEYTQSIVTV